MRSDVIIISNCKNDYLENITTTCLKSLLSSESNNDFNVIVIEGNEDKNHKNCKTLHPKIPFNYNAYVNLGLENCKSEFISFCNNDLIFQPNWFGSHLNVFNSKLDISSLCPKCPNFKDKPYEPHIGFNKGIYVGQKTRYELVGWCITARKKVFDKIGKLKTLVNFWCSDDIYGLQLKQNGLTHALNSDSIVQHLFGESTRNCNLNEKQMHNYTHDQLEIFNRYKKQFACKLI